MVFEIKSGILRTFPVPNKYDSSIVPPNQCNEVTYKTYPVISPVISPVIPMLLKFFKIGISTNSGSREFTINF
jgi:hypothetical protein